MQKVCLWLTFIILPLTGDRDYVKEKIAAFLKDASLRVNPIVAEVWSVHPSR
jgi:hypothetical protein